MYCWDTPGTCDTFAAPVAVYRYTPKMILLSGKSKVDLGADGKNV
jgi:hypothetical protein